MDLGAVILALIVSIGLKIPIMFISARLLLRMYRSTHSAPAKKLWYLIPKEDQVEFKTLYFSLILFFISELFCGVETYIIMQSNAYMRAIHAFSSSAGMGLFLVGLYILFDKRVIHYGKKRCVVNPLCKGCTLLAGDDCKFSSTILLIGTFFALAAIPPFFVSTEIINADPSKFILPFETLTNWYDHTLIPFIYAMDPTYKPIGVAFYLPTSTQIIENKIIPGMAILTEIIGIILYRRKQLAQKLMGFYCILFGAGMLCYTYFELILSRLIGDLFLGAIGHEIGEFCFLILLSEFLFRTFSPQKGLGIKRSETT